MTITHRFVDTNGIRMHIAEAGDGPLVLLCHGFPESWASYRHQLEALAAAGYHAVAPDQRGYGQTDAPQEIDQYTMLHLAGDLAGLIYALGDSTCVIVGHDMGSLTAQALALFRPDLVCGVVLLSVPYGGRGDKDMLSSMNERLGPSNYQQYFQEPGVAEASMSANVRATVINGLISMSADAPTTSTLSNVLGQSLSEVLDAPLPAWLTPDDVDYLVGEYERTGYRGSINWYRNSKINWDLMAAWAHAPLRQPSLFITGDKDVVYNWPGMQQFVPHLKEYTMPGLTKSVVVKNCGHWVQQEHANTVNELLLEFLDEIEW